jgi:hypothetical protein
LKIAAGLAHTRRKSLNFSPVSQTDLGPLGILVTDSHPFAALASVTVPMLSAEPLLTIP